MIFYSPAPAHNTRKSSSMQHSRSNESINYEFLRPHPPLIIPANHLHLHLHLLYNAYRSNESTNYDFLRPRPAQNKNTKITLFLLASVTQSGYIFFTIDCGFPLQKIALYSFILIIHPKKSFQENQEASPAACQ